MNNYYNPALTRNSQQLRKMMTPEERKLWYQFLKNCGCVVKRQKVISVYIVDFYIPSKKLIIEIDGSQHFSKEGKMSDQIRDKFLINSGFNVIRYSNDDIRFRFNEVCEDLSVKINC